MVIFSKIINKLISKPLLKSQLGRCGVDFRIGHSSYVGCPSSFEIGDHFFAGPHTYFTTNKETKIKIGSYAMFGPHCKIIGGNHNISWPDGPMMKAPYLGGGKGVIIEDDVWIGSGAVLLDGARLAEGVVVGAGSIVTGETTPYSVYAGVPARLIKHRFTKEEMNRVKSDNYSKEELLKWTRK